MSDADTAPSSPKIPDPKQGQSWLTPERSGALKRGLFALLFMALVALATTVLNLAALVQGVTLILVGKRNEFLMRFGRSLAIWIASATGFMTAATDDMPFPFAPWPDPDPNPEPPAG